MVGISLGERPVTSRLTSRSLWPAVLLSTGLGLSIERYSNLTWGNALSNPDVSRVFFPIAEGVAAGGRLYGPGLADNKPPVWQLLNVAAYESGEYPLVLLLCVGLANGLTAVLLWHWLSRTARSPIPILASVLFLVTLPLVGGHHINSRPFALLFLVGAFVVTGPVKRGVTMAIATLFNAYTALFVPVVLWRIRRDSYSSGPIGASAKYLASGAVTGLTVFGGIGLVWGMESVWAAFAWSFGLPLTEGATTAAVHPAADMPHSYLGQTWLISHPFRWLSYGGTVGLQLAVVFVLALAGLARRPLLGSTDLSQTMTVALGAATLPLFFRTYEQYWILPLPFLATFAALGVVVLSRSGSN